jgi:GntR family transcriptional regulator
MSRDRRSLPLQVRDELRTLIVTDRLGPGDPLPTEAEIADRFGVGRTTVREAFKLLEQDGLIDVRHGRGRFVAAGGHVERPVTRLESVTELMDAFGFRVVNRVLSITELAASQEEASALVLSPGDPVIRLERVRLQDQEPLIHSVDVLPRTVIPVPIGMVDWSGSLFDLLARFEHRVVASAAQIRATTLDPALASVIGVDGALPWLLMVQICHDDSGLPVIYSHDHHRGDLFTFNVLRRRGA